MKYTYQYIIDNRYGVTLLRRFLETFLEVPIESDGSSVAVKQRRGILFEGWFDSVLAGRIKRNTRYVH